jgi:hypothetical protein
MYSRIRNNELGREIDRRTWAAPTTIVLAYETKGSGTFTTELLDFGLTFEGPPFFTYGVELLEGETLVENDYPFVAAGVAKWEVKEPSQEDFEEKSLKLLHTGAYVGLNVRASKAYNIIFRMSFQGTAYKSPQYLR